MIPEKLGHLGSDKDAVLSGQIESRAAAAVEVGQMRLGLVRTEGAFRVGQQKMSVTTSL